MVSGSLCSCEAARKGCYAGCPLQAIQDEFVKKCAAADNHRCRLLLQAFRKTVLLLIDSVITKTQGELNYEDADRSYRRACF